MTRTARALYDAAARATLAPSIHNSQPWRFEVLDDRLDLYLDRARRLPAVDPLGREAAISCGAALFGLRVALAAAGLDATTSVLPDPTREALRRELRLVGHPQVLMRIGTAAPTPVSPRRAAGDVITFGVGGSQVARPRLVPTA